MKTEIRLLSSSSGWKQRLEEIRPFLALVLLLAVCMALSLAACGKKPLQEETAPEATAQPSAANEPAPESAQPPAAEESAPSAM